MLNKVLLIGNLGRDPEMRSLPSGQPVANFSLATTRKWKDRDGNKQEQTEWHNIVVFGKQAEIAGQYLNKGKQVYIEGRIQTRNWEKDGQKHYRTEIICDNFQMLGSAAGGGGRGGGNAAPEYDDHSYGGGGGGAAGGAASGEDDDIPF
jgi:single-strand DNA-binding protein